VRDNIDGVELDLPPKPASRRGKVSIWAYFKLFKKDILSARPARLYGAWMAEMRTPFFRSYMCNDPNLVDLVLKQRPMDFLKSERLRAGLKPLLGESIFISNGETWAHQRRIIDPAFEGGRLRIVFPAMWDCGMAAIERLDKLAGDKPVEVEAQTSHLAMDVIFRTLFETIKTLSPWPILPPLFLCQNGSRAFIHARPVKPRALSATSLVSLLISALPRLLLALHQMTLPPRS